MRITLDLELDYPVMLLLGGQAAKNGTAAGWWEGAGLDYKGDNKATIETLYQYAFADGMQYMLTMLTPKLKED